MGRKKSARVVEVIPGAKRLVSSLRDVGYDFPQAIADLVDNSIAAGASQVHIDLRFEGADSWIRVADNGDGMTGSQINEAMRYGANRSYEDDDLGKFGLGLKTASLSQCRSLTVASRTDPERNRVEVRQLDLDHVTSADRWEILDLGPDEREEVEQAVTPLERGHGTVVLWQNLDRVLKYKHAEGAFARKGFNAAAERLERHLGMVFHRYLAGEVKRRKKLTMRVNDNAVSPWDPFARSEPKTIALPEEEIEVHTEQASGLITYRPYVLPPKDQFSSAKQFESLSGPNKWNQQQGFYIYRAGRMIQSGGWCALRAADEHTKYARAAVEFFPNLDPAFEVNVAKVRVSLPPDLREKLKEATDRLCATAKKVYAKASERALSAPDASPAPPPPRSESRPHAGTGSGGARNIAEGRGGQSEIAGDPPGDSEEATVTTVTLREALGRAAEQAGELKAFARISDEFRKLEPDLARDYGW